MSQHHTQRHVRHWPVLSSLYLERARKAIVVMALSVTPLSLFFAHKSGYRIDEVALNFMIVAALLPLALGGVVGKCKADSSLAFLASLPVSRTEHAKSWLAVVVLLSLPLGATTMVACYHGPPALRGGALIAAGVGATIAAVSLTAVMIAMQLAAPPTMAVVGFGTALSFFVLLLAGVGQLFTWFPAQMNALVRSDLFLPILSLLLWMAAAGALWWSWQRIGHYMTSYVGDPPGA